MNFLLTYGRVAALCALFAFSVTLVHAQSPAPPEDVQMVRLAVPEGAPLRLILTQKLRFKLNQPARAKIVEPVYAFDREVVPAGTEVLGRISGFRAAPKWIRITSMLSGNFTPLREPELTFDTILLKDGKSFPIQTSVTPGADTIVRFNTAPTAEQKKSKAAAATELARKEIESRKRAVIDAIKAPGKMDRVKEAVWSFAPWHPQYLPATSRFNAKLRSPIEFDEVALASSQLTQVGSAPPPDTIVAARLVPSLDSRTASHGEAVEAVLVRPLFSEDNHLLFPEGSRLSGNIVQAQPARHWHRNGKLAFMFTRMEPPKSLVDELDAPAHQEIEGRLDGVEVNAKDGTVQIDDEGGAAAESSKKRFLAPAITTLLAMNGAEGREPVRVHHIKTGAYRNNYAGRFISGGVGFGLIGSAMGRLLGPIAPALGFYGAGRSIYSNLVARGQEVTFPADTPIEIRFTTPATTQK